MKHVVKLASREGLGARRIVNCTDSRVVLGGWGKGRSSSSRLNAIFRSTLGWCVLGEIDLSQVWLESHENPADDPSRDKPLRDPAALGSQAEELVTPGGMGGSSPSGNPSEDECLFQEVFAGVGGLTEAFRTQGVRTATPLEAYPRQGVYIKEGDILNPSVLRHLRRGIHARTIRYVHFGVPCSSFSIMQTMNGGTRTSSNPEGTGERKNEICGNELADVVCELCWLLYKSKGFFSIENPLSSFLWKYGPVDLLNEIAFDVDFDQCQFGLAPPHAAETNQRDLFIKKATRLRTNLQELKGLGVRCQGGHRHYRCLGSVRAGGRCVRISEAAGHYPRDLCAAWARLAGARLDDDARRSR